MPAVTILFGALVLLVTVAAFSSIRIAREYERALVSRHRYSTSVRAARPLRLQLRSGLHADCPDHIARRAREVKPE